MQDFEDVFELYIRGEEQKAAGAQQEFSFAQQD